MSTYLDQPLEPDAVIEAYKPGIDQSLIAENLKLTPTERLEQLEAMQRFVEDLREAGTDGGHPTR